MKDLNVKDAAKSKAKEQGIEWDDNYDAYFGQVEDDVKEWWEARPHQDHIDYAIQETR
ncbi:MAG: hypothetical protein ACR2RE_03080 [Geminicoccaceae bacterium]